MKKKTAAKKTKKTLSKKLQGELYDKTQKNLFTPHSNKPAVWRCPKCNDTWTAVVASRTRGSGCPYCAKSPPLTPRSILKNSAPRLANELANPSDALRFSSNSSESLVWRCDACKSYFSSSPNGRWDTRQRGSRIKPCPYCNNVLLDENNCLEATHPALAAELSHSFRGKCLHAGSDQSECWNCAMCGMTYVAKVHERVNGQGCSFCRGDRVSDKNCLSAVNPKLASELVNPNEGKRLREHSKDNVAWRCPKCKEIFAATVDNRSNGTGCPYCGTDKKKVSRQNSLKHVQPRLSKELANISDGERFIAGSGKDVPWKCQRCQAFFSASPSHRSGGTDCPYCSSPVRRVVNETCLAVTHPCIASEAIRRFDSFLYTAGSNEKIGWQCNKCSGVWVATPNNRTGLNATGCPYCNNRATSLAKSLNRQRPELALELEDYQDSYKYTVNSNEKVTWVCPKCKGTFPARIADRTKPNGTNCRHCYLPSAADVVYVCFRACCAGHQARKG